VIYIKVLINENNEPKIYVQIKDILYIKENNIKLPDSLIKNVNEVPTNNDLSSYIGFTDESEIAFFNNQDFIIDLNEYKNLSLKEIEERANDLITLINKIAIKYNNMNTENKKTNKDMKQMYNHLLYKFDSIVHIYAFRKKEIKSSFTEKAGNSYIHKRKVKSSNSR
jgi:hypothetical protein